MAITKANGGGYQIYIRCILLKTEPRRLVSGVMTDSIISDLLMMLGLLFVQVGFPVLSRSPSLAYQA